MVKVKEDMTGWVMSKHGVPDSKLTVIERAEDYIYSNGQRKARWLCECCCLEHNKVIADGTSLKNGKIKSCGCLRIENIRKSCFIDMTGWIMSEHGVPDSKLTVLHQADDYVSPDGIHITQWLCECSCSKRNKIIASGSHLRKGNTKSCGCLYKDKMIENSYNKKYNQYNLSGECGIGFTSNTNKEFYFDLEDYDKIKDYCWFEHIGQTGYSCLMAVDNNTDKRVKMHQLIFGKFCDHKNRNTLDNRKVNLREATHSQNSQNRTLGKNNNSGIIGVGWYEKYKKWRSRITINKKTITIGYFDDKTDAIKARLEAEQKYFGDFALQKHLYDQYNIKNQINEII